MIRISSNIEGFRRCGIAHSRKATDFPDGYFNDRQLAQLEVEPNLVVQQLPDGTPPFSESDYEAGYVAGKAEAEREGTDRIAEAEATAVAAKEGHDLTRAKLVQVTKERDDAFAELEKVKKASTGKGKA